MNGLFPVLLLFLDGGGLEGGAGEPESGFGRERGVLFGDAIDRFHVPGEGSVGLVGFVITARDFVEGLQLQSKRGSGSFIKHLIGRESFLIAAGLCGTQREQTVAEPSAGAVGQRIVRYGFNNFFVGKNRPRKLTELR